jgi:SOS response regulatory protein OraA/RecX
MSALGEDAEAEAMDAKRARIRAELEAQGLSPEEIEEVLMDMDADEEE